MITIYIAYSVSDFIYQVIVSHVESEFLRNINFNGMDYCILRDDFTMIDGDITGDVVALYQEIIDIIENK